MDYLNNERTSGIKVIIMADLFKEIIPAIMQTKKDVLVTEEDEKSYVPFIVNKALSFHLDCVMRANEMNMRPELDKKLQNHYMLNTIRGYKRPFQKWYKRKTEENIVMLQEYYNYSSDKAKEALRVLSDDQLNEIRRILNKGGSDDKLKQPGVGKASRR